MSSDEERKDQRKMNKACVLFPLPFFISPLSFIYSQVLMVVFFSFFRLHYKQEIHNPFLSFHFYFKEKERKEMEARNMNRIKGEIIQIKSHSLLTIQWDGNGVILGILLLITWVTWKEIPGGAHVGPFVKKPKDVSDSQAKIQIIKTNKRCSFSVVFQFN